MFPLKVFLPTNQAIVESMECEKHFTAQLVKFATNFKKIIYGGYLGINFQLFKGQKNEPFYFKFHLHILSFTYKRADVNTMIELGTLTYSF